MIRYGKRRVREWKQVESGWRVEFAAGPLLG